VVTDLGHRPTSSWFSENDQHVGPASP
jgi:hypothetical protein